MRFHKRSFETGGIIDLILPDDGAQAAVVRLWERADGRPCIGIEFDGKLVLLESIEDRQRTEQLAHDLRYWLSSARLVLETTKTPGRMA